MLDLVNIQKIKNSMKQQIKKVIGKMKDETKGVLIAEFVGLKPDVFVHK